MSFPQEDTNIEAPNSDPGLMSYFSGWGPSADMLFKPALSAPGGTLAGLFTFYHLLIYLFRCHHLYNATQSWRLGCHVG